MNTTVTLDSFQVIVGLYCIYIAIKGSGNMYNFFDVPDEFTDMVHKRLRIIYAVCGVLALLEAGLCMWQGTAGSTCPLNADQVSVISTVASLSIVAILIATFVWIRILAKKAENRDNK